VDRAKKQKVANMTESQKMAGTVALVTGAGKKNGWGGAVALRLAEERRGRGGGITTIRRRGPAAERCRAVKGLGAEGGSRLRAESAGVLMDRKNYFCERGGNGSWGDWICW